MSVIISIANEKGGVGKTTTAVNLAAGLALSLSDQPDPIRRVLLVDMDPQGHALLATAYGNHNAEPNDSLAAMLIETPPPSVQRLIRTAQHHNNLFFIPGNRGAMTEAARTLPTLMANENRLARALAPNPIPVFLTSSSTRPPTTGDLLINALVASTHVLIPVETSYLGVSGLRELQHTIEAVAYHFHPELQILGYLPTLCDEQRGETQEILVELQNRYSNLTLPPHP